MNKDTLEIKNASVAVSGNKIVSGASLSCHSGEIVLLIGPNGSGKSSLLNSIFGHPRFSFEGKIILNGSDISQKSTSDKAEMGLFLSLQHAPEIPGVNLLQFLHRAYKIRHGAKDLSVFDFKKKIEEMGEALKINTSFLGREINHKLSGGEKKQSEMLQLAALRPRFAFLDEIDSGVDVGATRIVFETIDFLRKNGTGFVLVTHNTNIAEHITPDRVYVMKEGAIIREGRSEILAQIQKIGFN